MNKYFLLYPLVLLLCCMCFVFSVYAGPNENAGIEFDLDTTTYGNQNVTNIPSQAAGTYLRLDVYCTRVHNLDTYEFEILYDQTEFEFISAVATNPITYEENILTSEGGTAIGWMISTTSPGVLGVAYTLTGTDTTQAPEGEGLVADIVFRVLTNTHRILCFDNVHFYNSFGEIDTVTDKGVAIPYEFGNINGTVRNSITNLPVVDATVSVGDYTDTTTDTDGTYYLEYIPLGVYDLLCEAEEYYDSISVVSVLENQTITKDFTLIPFQRGQLNGTVTDANTNEPIENALITAVSQNKKYTGFTDEDGYYIIDSLVSSEIIGNYIVTCDGGVPYTSGEVTNVEIVDDSTTSINFSLLAPVVVIEPMEIFPIIQNIGDSTTIDITISNTGTEQFSWQWEGIYNWFGRETDLGLDQLRRPLEIDFTTPSIRNVFSATHSESSLGLAPEIAASNSVNHSAPPIKLLRGSTGWAYNTAASGKYFYSFDTDTPNSANIINHSPNWKAHAGDFDSNSGDATYYIINCDDNRFARVDIETGIATYISTLTATVNYNWTGLSCDKANGIMYAIETFVDSTKLYTINLDTGMQTFIGSIPIPAAIDIAVDGEGVMWTYSIVTDSMYTIDPTTVTINEVGWIGFDANFAQGMSWDPQTDQVYLTAFNGANYIGEFRVLNRETGFCDYVGALPDNHEICALGFRGGPWVSVDQTFGTIEPGGSEILHATTYWFQNITPGEVKSADIVFSSIPDCGEKTVEVTATFGSNVPGSISGLVTLEDTPYSTGNVEDVLITAVSQRAPKNTYSASPDSIGEYVIEGIYPDIYNVTATLPNYQDTTIIDVVVLESQNTPSIDFEIKCLLSALQGTVTDGENPIENAEITVTPAIGRYIVYTDSLGYYEVDPIVAQRYELACSATGFAPYSTEIDVIANEVMVHDITMGNPTIDVIPSALAISLPPDTIGTELLTISNDGNATLGWNSTIDETQVSDFNIFSDLVSSSVEAETNLHRGGLYYNNYRTRDMWDVLFGYDVRTLSGGNGIAGAEFGNGFFLVAEWGYSSRNVFKFDVNGNYIGCWEPTWIPGSGGLRDMAFDGEYFYGSDATHTIYQYDVNGNLHGTIDAPANVRSIAYDDDHDAFWINDWEEDILLIDRSGNTLNTISSPPSMYGSAYDNVSEGGPYLWIFTGTIIGQGCQVEQYDLNTLALTGETHSISEDFGNCTAGGLFTSGDIVDGKWILGGVTQGSPEILFGYEIASYVSWLEIEPASGLVEAGCDSLVTVYFDTHDIEVGTVKTANITFSSNPDVGDVVIPVTLTVEVGIPDDPENYNTKLLGNYPNPFDVSTTIKFSLKEATHVKLSIYNIRGQLVDKLIDEDMVPGKDYQVEWSGVTSKNQKLTNGIYFYKLETEDKTYYHKMILMQ